MITVEKDIADPQLRQELYALGRRYAEAANNNDAVAIAALYTEDAVFVTDTGPLYGRQAIEKFYAGVLQQWRIKNYISNYDQDSPYTIGTAGNERWANGEWSYTAEVKGGDPFQLKGFWSSIDTREGNDWKIRMLTWNITPAPVAAEAK
jgi:ketosteroid isomerase-like protein